MKNESVQPATQGQVKDVIATLISAMPNKLTRSQAEAIAAQKGKFIRSIREAFKKFVGWRVIQIGGESKEEILKKLSETRVKIWATSLVHGEQFTVERSKRVVTLEMKTLSELGFQSEPHLTQIRARIEELGYEPCPPEIGPRLWIAQADMELADGSYFLVMDLLPDMDGRLALFQLTIDTSDRCSKCHWLHADHGIERSWSLGSRMVFVNP